MTFEEFIDILLKLVFELLVEDCCLIPLKVQNPHAVEKKHEGAVCPSTGLVGFYSPIQVFLGFKLVWEGSTCLSHPMYFSFIFSN